MNLTPIVIEQNGRGERSYDIYSRLLIDRIIILFGEITDATSASIISQLLFLSSNDENKDIYIYINSPGGSVTAGLSIYDTMKYIKPKVVTIGMGLCASMGAFLLSSGDKRYALENTKIMIHQPLGGAKGQATDILISAKHIEKTKNKMIDMLSTMTGNSRDKIAQDVERDYFMDSAEAKEYGIVDKVLDKR
jgi:ATP-dependent Clp protease protease subunit